MSHDGPSCVSDPPETVRELDARSSLYAVLARGFSHPDEDVVEFFRRCDGEGCSEAGELGACLRALLARGRATPPEELQRAYLRLFDPVAGPFPYETEHAKLTSAFFKAQHLADVMGFYRAFGVEPRKERADDLGSELEFMHFLTLKEAHARRAGRPEDAELCHDAQVKFFRDHLMTWTDDFLEAMRGRQGIAPFYAHLIELLDLFLATEKEALT